YQCPGGSVFFTAEMLVDGLWLPATYQWFHDGVPLPGATDTTLNLTNLRFEDTGAYNVLATSVCGSGYSAQNFPINLQIGITIDSQPIDTSGQVCRSTEFVVKAHGFGDLHYQWRLDGVPLQPDVHFSGNDTNKLVISPILYALEGDYDVIITDNC